MIESYFLESGSDEYKVTLTTGEDAFFQKEDVLDLVDRAVDIVEVSLYREKGIGMTSIKTLMRITEIIANYLGRHRNAILYYYCDEIDFDSFRQTKSDWPPQKYRSQLFSDMFERYTRVYNLVDYCDRELCIEANDHPSYMHLISHVDNEPYIDSIIAYLRESYGK